MFERILVAYDGSEPSLRALKAGVELAAKFGQPLRAITVVESVPNYVTAGAYAPIDPAVIQQIEDQQKGYTMRLLTEATEIASAAGVDLTTEAVAGDEVELIVDAVIRHRADLLVVGLRHHPGLMDRLVSHTVHNIAEKAPCSVLGVR